MDLENSQTKEDQTIKFVFINFIEIYKQIPEVVRNKIREESAKYFCDFNPNLNSNEREEARKAAGNMVLDLIEGKNISICHNFFNFDSLDFPRFNIGCDRVSLEIWLAHIFLAYLNPLEIDFEGELIRRPLSRKFISVLSVFDANAELEKYFPKPIRDKQTGFILL